tara:strand:+ start:70 stop:369 length:300 start_codon:yes stop_codon:yes gene_type:complete
MEVSPFERSIVIFNTSTMLNIDIVISKNENKNVAIEFNEPSHYVQCNERDVENGTTQIQTKVFGKTKLNFAVVSIYFHDWQRAREANTHKKTSNRNLLN